MKHVKHMIRMHLAGELPADEGQLMRVHIRDCEACREEYDLLASVLRAAAAREPTRREMEVWRRSVLEQLPGRASRPPLPRAPSLVRRLALLAPALAAAVILLLCGLLLQLAPAPAPLDAPRRQARGGVADPLMELEVFGIRAPEGGQATPRRLEDGDSLRLDEYIQFRYANSHPDVHHLYLLGLDHRQQPMDYYPRPSQQRSIPVEVSAEMISVRRSIRLSTRHQPGILWVIALYSRRPLERQEAHDLVRLLQARGLEPGALAPPAPGVYPVLRQFVVLQDPR
jgi:hypothetical protein